MAPLATYVSKAPDVRAITVEERLPTPCRRRFVRFVHPLMSRVVAPFEHNLDNLISGLKERVYYLDTAGTLPPPFVGDAAPLRVIGNELVTCVPLSCRYPLEAVHYVKTRPARTKRLYEQALRDIQRGIYRPRDWARTALFTKTEKTQHASLYEELDRSKVQVPRIINPRKPHYNILLGRRLYAVEKHIFHAMQIHAGQEHPVVAKGLTSRKKASVIVDHINSGYTAIGLDASRFDQSIRRDLLMVEHHVYKKLFAGDLELAQLLKLQLNNHGRVTNKYFSVSCSYGAIRCSGDVNTSLGNCIISYLMVVSYMRHLTIQDYRVFLDGDDLLLFIRPNQVGLVSSTYGAYYLQYGLRMKLDCIATFPEQVEFCQSKPVNTGRYWTLCRDPLKVLNTDYCGYDQCRHDNYYSALLRNVGLCGMEYARGVPILQEYYQFGIRSGSTGKMNAELTHSGMRINMAIASAAGEYNSTPTEVMKEARISFALAFGISPQQQLRYEGMIRSYTYSTRKLQLCEGYLHELATNPVFRDIEV